MRSAGKRVVIVHGWSGEPDEGWFLWLATELRKRGCTVAIPELPDPNHPHPRSWVPALADAVEAMGGPDEHLFFVGHSMGCQAIIRYLETLPDETTVGGAVFVAGFMKRLTDLEGPEEKAIAKEWLGPPVEFEKLHRMIPRSIALFSDDDPWVPLDNQDAFRDGLKSEIHVEARKGHWSGPRDGAHETPDILDAVLHITEA